MNRWQSKMRRGTTIVDTAIIIIAFVLTIVVFSIIVMKTGILTDRESEVDTPQVVQEVNASIILEEDSSLKFGEDNITDSEFYEFAEYVFGTLRKLNGFYYDDPS